MKGAGFTLVKVLSSHIDIQALEPCRLHNVQVYLGEAVCDLGPI